MKTTLPVLKQNQNTLIETNLKKIGMCEKKQRLGRYENELVTMFWAWKAKSVSYLFDSWLQV